MNNPNEPRDAKKSVTNPSNHPANTNPQPIPRADSGVNPPQASSSSAAGPAKRRFIPLYLARLEPMRPSTIIDQDPVFESGSAAKFLGVSVDCLKKWRQRGHGPDYFQYEQNGAVRYLLTDLVAFREAHRVDVQDKPRGSRK